MPTNRRPLARKRNASFTPETLALFLELEHTPARQRWSDAFKVKAKELMFALGLDGEFVCSLCSVLDTSARPIHTPPYAEYWDWHTCRRVREQLLAASGSVAAPPRAQ